MAEDAMSDRETTADLQRRLKLRYSKRAGEIMLFEVGDGAGFHNSGWSDAIAMQTWPSKGLAITGFEIKASRKDWLAELNKPMKNRLWQETCDEWYVVTVPGVWKPEELPASWGVMIPSGADKLRIVNRCEKQARPDEHLVDRQLLAAVFRAADSERRKFLQNAAREAREEADARCAEQMADLEEKARKAHIDLTTIKIALGQRYGSMDEVMAVAKAIEAFEPEWQLDRVRGARCAVEGLVQKLADAEKELATVLKKEGGS